MIDHTKKELPCKEAALEAPMVSLVRIQGHKASIANVAVKNDTRKYYYNLVPSLYKVAIFAKK